MSINITEKILEEDKKILEKMDKLRLEHKENTKEYKELFRQYYVDNDDIRIHWQTR